MYFLVSYRINQAQESKGEGKDREAPGIIRYSVLGKRMQVPILNMISK